MDFFVVASEVSPRGEVRIVEESPFESLARSASRLRAADETALSLVVSMTGGGGGGGGSGGGVDEPPPNIHIKFLGKIEKFSLNKIRMEPFNVFPTSEMGGVTLAGTFGLSPYLILNPFRCVQQVFAIERVMKDLSDTIGE